MNPKEKPDATRPAFLFLSPLGRKKERDRQRLKPQIDKIKIGKAPPPACAPSSSPALATASALQPLTTATPPAFAYLPIVYLSFLPIWGFSLCLSPSCLSLPPTPEAPTPSHPSPPLPLALLSPSIAPPWDLALPLPISPLSISPSCLFGALAFVYLPLVYPFPPRTRLSHPSIPTSHPLSPSHTLPSPRSMRHF